MSADGTAPTLDGLESQDAEVAVFLCIFLLVAPNQVNKRSLSPAVCRPAWGTQGPFSPPERSRPVLSASLAAIWMLALT